MSNATKTMDRALLSIYCADVGSIKRQRFGWARLDNDNGQARGSNISALVASLADDINADNKVTLGFECPLYVPISNDPNDLTTQRAIEQGRPWSAGAGAQVLAVGLTETVWIMSQLREAVTSPPNAFLDWTDFCAAESGLFLWEAMVTGTAKARSPNRPEAHQDDALIATRAFRQWMAEGASLASDQGEVYSLIGAALLRTGWSNDISLLGQPCAVIRARPAL